MYCEEIPGDPPPPNVQPEKEKAVDELNIPPDEDGWRGLDVDRPRKPRGLFLPTHFYSWT